MFLLYSEILEIKYQKKMAKKRRLYIASYGLYSVNDVCDGKIKYSDSSFIWKKNVIFWLFIIWVVHSLLRLSPPVLKRRTIKWGIPWTKEYLIIMLMEIRVFLNHSCNLKIIQIPSLPHFQHIFAVFLLRNPGAARFYDFKCSVSTARTDKLFSCSCEDPAVLYSVK